jgi:hypothetical protein
MQMNKKMNKEELLKNALSTFYGNYANRIVETLLKHSNSKLSDLNYIKKLDSVGNGSLKVKHQIDSLIWEAQLGKYFSENENVTYKSHKNNTDNTWEGPDFKIQHKKCKNIIWVEAVAPNKGNTDLTLFFHSNSKLKIQHFLKISHNLLPFGYLSLSLLSNEIKITLIWYVFLAMLIPTTKIPSEGYLSRYTNSINEKAKTFKRYSNERQKKGVKNRPKAIVNRSDICIIAISSIGLCPCYGFDEPVGNGSIRLPYAFQAVYGKLKEYSYSQYKKELCRDFSKPTNGTSINADGFLNKNYNYISAILAADTSPYPGSEAKYIIIHNINAVNPLPTGLFQADEELSVEYTSLKIKDLKIDDSVIHHNKLHKKINE